MAKQQGTKEIKGIFDWQGITMGQNREQNWKDITLKSLESELRRLPEPEIPDALEDKLLAAIPEAKPKAQEHHVIHHPRARDFGLTAAAAVLIFALIFLVNYGLSVPSSANFYDTSLVYPRWEESSFLDDQNSACIEKTLPRELR